jgi:long-chain acyl-CoA synthetase
MAKKKKSTKRHQGTEVSLSETTKTLDTLFFDRVRRFSGGVAFREYDPTERIWRNVSWAGLGLEMTRWRGALDREELADESRVAMMMHNCKEWVVCEQATMVLDLINVPIYPNESADNVAYILNDCAAQILVIDNLRLWQKLQGVHHQLEKLKRIVILHVLNEEEEARVHELDDPRVVLAKDWLPVEGGPLHERYADSNAIATIVYTPGTDGNPKGVMLSHINILSNSRAVLSMMAIRNSDVFYSTLSLAHIVQRTCGLYAPMMSGAVVAFNRSMETLASDLQELNPSIMISETHHLTKLKDILDDELKEESWLDRIFFRSAVAAGWGNFEVEQKLRTFSSAAMMWPVLKGIALYTMLPKIAGRRLRRIICSGSPLPPNLAKLFIGMGFNIMHGYHVTEASGLISLNPVIGNNPSSVGMTLPGYRLKIDTVDNVTISSDSMLSPGYMGRASDEHESALANDRFQTGDMGKYEEEHLYFLGHDNNMITIINGKQIEPEIMELALCADELIEHAVIVGYSQPILCAILVLNRAKWIAQINKLKIEATQASNYDNPRIHDFLMARIQKQLLGMDDAQYLKTFIVSDEPWTVDGGHLTAVHKPRRKVIEHQFKNELYEAFSHAIAEASAEELEDSKGADNDDDDIPTLS